MQYNLICDEKLRAYWQDDLIEGSRLATALHNVFVGSRDATLGAYHYCDNNNKQYPTINSFLESNSAVQPFDDVHSIVADVIDLVASMRPCSEAMMLHRGGRFGFDESVAKISLERLTSTSISKETACFFYDGVHYVIRVKAGTPVLYFGDSKIKAGFDNEVLLPPMVYKVNSNAKNNLGIRVVELESEAVLDVRSLLLGKLTRILDMYGPVEIRKQFPYIQVAGARDCVKILGRGSLTLETAQSIRSMKEEYYNAKSARNTARKSPGCR